MCNPAIVVAVVTTAVTTGLGIAQAQAQAAAVRRSNDIATSQAIGKRSFESQQITTEKQQALRKQQVQGHQIILEGLQARGRLQAGIAEAGLGGNVTHSLVRGLNLDQSSKLGNLDVAVRHTDEASYLKDIGSAMSMRHQIEALPEVPGTGLGIASSVVSGLGSGFSAGMATGKALDSDFTMGDMFKW